METDPPIDHDLSKDTCPNCLRTGRSDCLVISETEVTHCGCYYEDDERAVIIHFNRDPGREEKNAHRASQKMSRSITLLQELHIRTTQYLSELSAAQAEMHEAQERARKLRLLATDAARRLGSRSV